MFNACYANRSLFSARMLCIEGVGIESFFMHGDTRV